VSTTRALSCCMMAVFALTGCGWSGETVDRIGQGDGVQIPPRYASVISDGCTPDTWQASALAGADMRRFVKEVVLLCAVPRQSGAVGPADSSARAQLAKTADALHQQGYLVKLGVEFRDETAERYDGALTAKELADATWRAQVAEDLTTLAASLDGVELDLQTLPASARADLTSFVRGLNATLHGTKKIAILAPRAIRRTSPVETPSISRRWRPTSTASG
jgi:hypothetical protein